MDDDRTDERAKTGTARLALVHDRDVRTGEPRIDSEEFEIDEAMVRDLESMRKNVVVDRFPEHTPVAATTDAHWTAQYQGETTPAPRVETPPAMPATIINLTDPGRDIGPIHPDYVGALAEEKPASTTVPTLRREIERDAETFVDEPTLRKKAVAIGIGAGLILIAPIVAWAFLHGAGPEEQGSRSGDRASASAPSTLVAPPPPVPSVTTPAPTPMAQPTPSASSTPAPVQLAAPDAGPSRVMRTSPSSPREAPEGDAPAQKDYARSY